MTDLELTKACAEAMGFRIASSTLAPYTQHPKSSVRVAEGKKATRWYDPLHDDAQAMALVKRVKLRVLRCDEEFPEVIGSSGIHEWHVFDINSENEGFYHEDLNRAICECVAKIKVSSAPKP